MVLVLLPLEVCHAVVRLETGADGFVGVERDERAGFLTEPRRHPIVANELQDAFDKRAVAQMLRVLKVFLHRNGAELAPVLAIMLHEFLARSEADGVVDAMSLEGLATFGFFPRSLSFLNGRSASDRSRFGSVEILCNAPESGNEQNGNEKRASLRVHGVEARIIFAVAIIAPTCRWQCSAP